MIKGQLYTILFFMLTLVMYSSCGRKGSSADNVPLEDTLAKRQLQGVWINKEDEVTFFMVKGDTIYYPDSTSLPMAFQIVDDTLYMKGANEVEYAIVKQTPHFFSFRNQTGDVYELEKADDETIMKDFQRKQPIVLNQNMLIKRDTVVTWRDKRYHAYMQVNPTTYKVYRTVLNSEGVEVSNVYYDNIVHLSVYADGRKLFSSNFYKKDFQEKVPASLLDQSILSDITFQNVDAQGVHFHAVIGVPDSPSSYLVEVIVSLEGACQMRVQ